MTDPLNQRTGGEHRRSPAEKVQSILAVLDIVQEVLRALLGIFGRRKSDG